MPTKSSELPSGEVRSRADASLRKEERARDGAKAMTEYLENGRVVRERMERLRALRLAKEAVDGKTASAGSQANAKPKPVKAAKRQGGGR